MGPQNGWFIIENPIKMDEFGGTTIFGNTHIHIECLCTFKASHYTCPSVLCPVSKMKEFCRNSLFTHGCWLSGPDLTDWLINPIGCCPSRATMVDFAEISRSAPSCPGTEKRQWRIKTETVQWNETNPLSKELLKWMRFSQNHRLSGIQKPTTQQDQLPMWFQGFWW